MANRDQSAKYVKENEERLVPMPGYAPLVVVEATGSIARDVTGRDYIDFVSQVAGPTAVGSCNPRVIKAVENQLRKLPCVSPWFVSLPRLELARKLTSVMPGFERFYFQVGGGEAVEFGIKTAIRATRRQEVVSLELGYHGSSIACLSLGQPWHRRGIPSVPGFTQIPPAYCYRCFYGQEYPGCNLECGHALENHLRYGTHDDVAAFVLEPIQGCGGHITPPTPEYFRVLRETCSKHGILMLVDEIQTGLGRTGKMWAYEYYNFVPDIVAVGKALGGGLPISATAFSKAVQLPLPEDQEIMSTQSATPIGCAAGCEVISILQEEHLADRAAALGKVVQERLLAMKERHPLIGDVRCAGLFIGIELVRNRATKERAVAEAARVIEAARKRGLIILLSNKAGVGNVIKLKPPLTIDQDLLVTGLEILEAAIAEVEGSH